MEKIYKSVFLLILSIGLSQLRGQVCGPTTQTIDLSTGIDKNGQLISILAPDDDWQVLTPGSSSYQPIYCGSGWLDGVSQYGSAFSGLWNNTNNAGTGLNSDVRWLSPYIDPVNGGHLVQPSYSNGFTFYLINFNLDVCNAQSAILQFDFIAADDSIHEITINGWNYNVNYYYDALGSAINKFTPNPAPINVPVWQLNLAGPNYIRIKVDNSKADHTGLSINGRLKVRGDFFLDFNLKDKDGNVKTEYCFGEDVFLSSAGSNTGACTLDLFYDNGSGFNQVAPQQSYIGYPDWINITDMFGAQNVTFSTTGIYKVKMTMNGPGNCGPFEASKEFKFRCCEPLDDASFSLSLFNGQVKGNSTVKGIHEWNVYSSPNVNPGPYTYIKSYLGQSFSYESVPGQGPCYLVTHRVSNECIGEVCASQSICNPGCGVAICNLASAHLSIDYQGNHLSWNPIPGAVKYIVEVIKNGCCGPPDMNNSSTTSAMVQETFYDLDITGSGTGDETGGTAECYLVRVYAVCEDGTRSQASNELCINQIPGPAPSNGGPELGTGIISAITVNLFPNPAHGTVTIDVNTSYETELRASIYDATGRIVKTLERFNTNKGQTEVVWYIESLASGIYLVEIKTSDSKVINRELVIY